MVLFWLCTGLSLPAMNTYTSGQVNNWDQCEDQIYSKAHARLSLQVMVLH